MMANVKNLYNDTSEPGYVWNGSFLYFPFPKCRGHASDYYNNDLLQLKTMPPDLLASLFDRFYQDLQLN